MKKESKTKQFIGFILTLAIKINFYLPNSISYWLSLISSRLGMFVNSKTSQTINENIKLCFPQLSEKERSQLIRNYLKQNAFMSKETSIAWLGSKKQIENKFATVTNQLFITEVQQKNKPLIIVIPHIGNWEFFGHWLQFNYPMMAFYTPAKTNYLDRLVLNARQRFGGNPYSADRSGMIKILRGLKQHKIMMMMPDQAPNLDSGIYSPFFGYPALTITLLQRLIQQTNAQCLFATCIRNAHRQFDIQFYKPEFDPQISELESFNQSLNKQIENLIKATPEQYVWDYKRFKRQPSGEEIYTSDRLRREKHERNNKNIDT